MLNESYYVLYDLTMSFCDILEISDQSTIEVMLVQTTNSGCNIYFRLLTDSSDYGKKYRSFRKKLVKKCEKSDIFREKLQQIYVYYFFFFFFFQKKKKKKK